MQKVSWTSLDQPGEPPACLGRLTDGRRSEPLAITQLRLLYHLLNAAR